MGIVDSVVASLWTTIETVTGIEAPTPPEINYYTSIQAAKKGIVTQIEQGRVTMPFWVICVGKFTAELEMGIDNWAQKRMPVHLFCVAQWGGTNGSQDWVNGQVTAVGNHIDNPENVIPWIGNCNESCEIDSDITADINHSLLGSSKTQIVSAYCKWEPGFFINVN